MNAPLVSIAPPASFAIIHGVAPNARRRGIDVEFLSERYHRSFDEEAAALEALLVSVGDVSGPFAALSERLQRHEHLQERCMFPAYESLAPMNAAMFETWVDDSATLADALADLRVALATNMPRAALRDRVAHFAAEVERHLVDEAEILAAWATDLE